MICEKCGHNEFKCDKCKEVYDFSAADRLVDVEEGTTVLVTWMNEYDEPVSQIEVSQENAESWQWLGERHRDAERHIDALYEALGFRPDEESDPMRHIAEMRDEINLLHDAESIMQDLVDYLEARVQEPPRSAESRLRAIATRVANHFGKPLPEDLA